MSKASQRPDVVQWYDKSTDRFVKIQRETGEVISNKVTPGPYKNIHVAKRRPSLRSEPGRTIKSSTKIGTVPRKVAEDAVKAVKVQRAKTKAPEAAPKKKKPKSLAAQKKPRKPRKVNYLNNKDLLLELEKSREQDQMTDKLAHMLQTLAARYGKRGNYVGYSYNEDMQAFAMMGLVKTWRAFNPEKSNNPFAFFTQCIKNSFIQFLNHEAKHRTIRDEMMVDQGLDASYAYQEKYAARMAEERAANSDELDLETSERDQLTQGDSQDS